MNNTLKEYHTYKNHAYIPCDQPPVYNTDVTCDNTVQQESKQCTILSGQTCLH
jgi:hypothetical protein